MPKIRVPTAFIEDTRLELGHPAIDMGTKLNTKAKHKNQELKNPRTQEPKNPRTQEPKNPRTQEPKNPRTQEPKNTLQEHNKREESRHAGIAGGGDGAPNAGAVGGR
jgi:hypothetical protein